MLTDITDRLTSIDLALVIVIALIAVVLIFKALCFALVRLVHGHPPVESDELADRFEEVLRDSTRDLLAQLELIEHDTTALVASNEYLAEREREFEAEERAERTNHEAEERARRERSWLHRYVDEVAAWGSGAGVARPDAHDEREAIDLTKPAQDSTDRG